MMETQWCRTHPQCKADAWVGAGAVRGCGSIEVTSDRRCCVEVALKFGLQVEGPRLGCKECDTVKKKGGLSVCRGGGAREGWVC